MSENADRIRAGFDAFQSGDVEGMLGNVAADALIERSEPDAGTWHGPQGLLEAVTDWVASFEEFDASVADVVENGDWAVARIHQRATGKASGARVEDDFWFAYEFADGKLARLLMTSDRAHAYEVAGLSN